MLLLKLGKRATESQDSYLPFLSKKVDFHPLSLFLFSCLCSPLLDSSAVWGSSILSLREATAPPTPSDQAAATQWPGGRPAPVPRTAQILWDPSGALAWPLLPSLPPPSLSRLASVSLTNRKKCVSSWGAPVRGVALPLPPLRQACPPPCSPFGRSTRSPSTYGTSMTWATGWPALTWPNTGSDSRSMRSRAPICPLWPRRTSLSWVWRASVIAWTLSALLNCC